MIPFGNSSLGQSLELIDLIDLHGRGSRGSSVSWAGHDPLDAHTVTGGRHGNTAR